MVDINVGLLQLLIIAIIGWVIIDFFTIFTKNAMVTLHLNPKNTIDSGMVLIFYFAVFLGGIILCSNIQNQINMDIGNISVPLPITSDTNNINDFKTYTNNNKKK
jgi:hypothetical protein